jgi:hypothetical protein
MRKNDCRLGLLSPPRESVKSLGKTFFRLTQTVKCVHIKNLGKRHNTSCTQNTDTESTANPNANQDRKSRDPRNERHRSASAEWHRNAAERERNASRGVVLMVGPPRASVANRRINAALASSKDGTITNALDLARPSTMRLQARLSFETPKKF